MAVCNRLPQALVLPDDDDFTLPPDDDPDDSSTTLAQSIPTEPVCNPATVKLQKRLLGMRTRIWPDRMYKGPNRKLGFNGRDDLIVLGTGRVRQILTSGGADTSTALYISVFRSNEFEWCLDPRFRSAVANLT